MSLVSLIAPRTIERQHPGVRLALAYTDLDTGEGIAWRADDVLPIASTAKVLLLATIAREIGARRLSPGLAVSVHAEDRVGGTGVLSALRANPSWTVTDLAHLVAAVSDNTATNALLRCVGLDAVAATATALGISNLHIHDYVRDARGPQHPAAFSTGTTHELCRLMELTARGELGAGGAGPRVLGWMAANEDHALFCAPLPHDRYDWFDALLKVCNKTGRDVGVRADVGIIDGHRTVAYAAVATCAPGDEWAAVLALRAVGQAVGNHLTGH